MAQTPDSNKNTTEGASPGPSTYEGAPANPPETHSGETLLVVAYILVWVAVLAFVAAAWRRTRGLEGRLATIERALEKARAAQVPSTKRSGASEE
jgi:hypothetical protein